MRSNDDGALGLLADVRRMNVALTRARRFLLVVGDAATLGGHPHYADFLAAVERGGAYVSAYSDDGPAAVTARARARARERAWVTDPGRPMRYRPGVRLLIASLLLAACGARPGTAAPPAAAATPSPATRPASAVAGQPLALGDVTVTIDEKPTLRLRADGQVEIATEDGGWQPGPALTAGGAIRFDGADVAVLRPDGQVEDLRTGKPWPGVEIGDRRASAQHGESSISFEIADDGALEVVGSAAGATRGRVDGAATPELRRTILLALISMVDPEPNPARPAGSPPAGPTP